MAHTINLKDPTVCLTFPFWVHNTHDDGSEEYKLTPRQFYVDISLEQCDALLALLTDARSQLRQQQADWAAKKLKEAQQI